MARSSGARALEHCRRRYAITIAIAKFRDSRLTHGPLTNEEETVSLAVKGEIYNHRILRKGLKNEYKFKTHSDCEVIIPLVSFWKG
jgi:asparagine synthetase B (glutamine-hydrolysing)